jgi:hypothetical protein
VADPSLIGRRLFISPRLSHRRGLNKHWCTRILAERERRGELQVISVYWRHGFRSAFTVAADSQSRLTAFRHDGRRWKQTCFEIPLGSTRAIPVSWNNQQHALIALTPEQRQTVESRFRELANQWTGLTVCRSNLGAPRRHPLFDEIVALGEPAIPLLLGELARKPSISRFGLLATTTGENPVPPELAGLSCRGNGTVVARVGPPAGIFRVSAELERIFPALACDGCVVVSPETTGYHFIAWAALSGQAANDTSLPDQGQSLVGNVISQVKPGSAQLFNHGTGRRNEADLLRQNDQAECPSDSDFQELGSAHHDRPESLRTPDRSGRAPAPSSHQLRGSRGPLVEELEAQGRSSTMSPAGSPDRPGRPRRRER